MRVISAEASPAAFCTYRSSISAEDARPAQQVAREFKPSLAGSPPAPAAMAVRTASVATLTSPAGDLFKDIGSGLGPNEGLWIGVVMIEIVLNCSFELGDTLEYATPDAIACDQAEKAFDLIEPRRRSGGEMHMEARVFG
ncbi:hypothetical protein HFN76_35585, partial [Rhizobium laguerreae]|nr:hypothetical protein [Rhizobium laguerreae]